MGKKPKNRDFKRIYTRYKQIHTPISRQYKGTTMELTNSINSFNEAKQVIVGGVNSPVRAFKSVGGTPPFIAKAKGYELYDIDGNAYVDFVQSWGPLILGHANEAVQEAVIAAVKNGLSYGAPTMLETMLVKEILSCYEGIDKMRLVSSGTEATMSAIRLARAYSGKEDIIKFDGCYHGHSDSLLVGAGSGCATFGHPSSPGVIEDLGKHTLVARYNDIDSVIACIRESETKGKGVACIIIEPIAGNMGLVPAEKDFLLEIRKLCDKYEIVLIVDEVMSGFRASINGVQGFVNIKPDLATFGKVIGGGMPLAAFGGVEEIMRLLSPQGAVYQAGTLSGNPIATSAGLATLKQIKAQNSTNNALYTRLESLATRLVNGLKEQAKKHNIVLETCVQGSMFGFFMMGRDIKGEKGQEWLKYVEHRQSSAKNRKKGGIYNFDEAKKADTELFGRFHNEMLKRGVYFACSQFESGFICAPMNESIIDSVIEKASDSFRTLD